MQRSKRNLLAVTRDTVSPRAQSLPRPRGVRALWLALACAQQLACQDFTRSERDLLGENAGLPGETAPPRRSDAELAALEHLPARDAWSEYLATPVGDCGEYREGLRLRAAQNPATAAQANAAAPLAAEPTLEKMYESGHFKIYYTTTHPTVAHRVTLDEVKTTATILNDAWNLYVANFTEPKHLVSAGKKYISVKIFDLADIFGVTSSNHNTIYLDAPSTVKDPCQRKSTAVHELFHRVEYAYGYVTGGVETGWFSEGMASWAEKFAANSTGIWLHKVQTGLRTPGAALLERTNDAIHYWTFLSELVGGEEATIRDLWECFSFNANVNQSMYACLSQELRDHVADYADFVWYSSIWHSANLRKDLVTEDFYDYSDDEATRSCGGKSYGPFDSVYQQRTATLSLGETISGSQVVKSHGAHYWTFDLLTGINKLQVTINEGASLRKGYNFHLLTIAGDDLMVQYNRWNPSSATTTFDVTFGTAVDKAVLLVVGAPYGGSYDFTVKGLAVPVQ